MLRQHFASAFLGFCLGITFIVMQLIPETINVQPMIRPIKEESTAKSTKEKTTVKPNNEGNIAESIKDETTANPNSEETIVDKKNDDSKCSRILMLLPIQFSLHGHGSQINNYLMGAIAAMFLDRAFLLLDPDPLSALSIHKGGSQFGCPVDAFEGKVTREIFSSDLVNKDFPMGLSRLVDNPQWLSRGCPIPCTDKYSYNDWVRISRGPENRVVCTNSGGSVVDVVVYDGWMIRFLALGGHVNKLMVDHDDTQESIDLAERWAFNMGATSLEAKHFASMKADEYHAPIWDFALALINRSGFLHLQPWIERDIESYLASFDLPMNGDYSAIHVRRGDKLILESVAQVTNYWSSRGYNKTNMPTNYIPFSAYLEKWDGQDICPKNDAGEVQVMNHHVYVATDDPTVVRQEIVDLPNHTKNDPFTVLWKTCHEIKFYFSPAINEMVFHIAGGEGESCFAKYHRNIVSMTDLMILLKAKTAIVEFSSNWGRLVRNLRVRFNNDTSATYILDTRDLFGIFLQACQESENFVDSTAKCTRVNSSSIVVYS